MRETIAKLPDGYRMNVAVYRSDFDCTNGGLTSQHDRIRIVADDYKPGQEVERPSGVAPYPAFYIRERGGAIHAYPADVPESAPGFSNWQFGGNFIFCSDSRFPNQYPIPVHDRRES